MLLEILINYKRPETLKVINMNKYLNNITLQEIDESYPIRFKRYNNNLIIHIESYYQIKEAIKSNLTMVYTEECMKIINRDDLTDNEKNIMLRVCAVGILMGLLLIETFYYK